METPTFSSSYYRAHNPDVDKAIKEGRLSSAAEHYDTFGVREGRAPVAPPALPPAPKPLRAPPPSKSVESRMQGLLTSDSPYMRTARAQGQRMAQRRGLLNSSIAAGASEDAAIRAAMPIAARDAEIDMRRDLARWEIEARQRERAAAGYAEASRQYAALFGEISRNPEIPAEARARYLDHIRALQARQAAMVQSVYGVKVDWAPLPSASGGGGPRSAAPWDPTSPVWLRSLRPPAAADGTPLLGPSTAGG